MQLSRPLLVLGIVGTLLPAACSSAPAASPGPTVAPVQNPAPATTRPPASPTTAMSPTAGPAARAELTGQFVNPLSTLEDMDTLQIELGRVPGITSVSGGEHSITITYDSSRITPERIRQVLTDLRHPIR